MVAPLTEGPSAPVKFTQLANVVGIAMQPQRLGDKRPILEEFIAATGYHEESEIRVLNSHPEPKHRQTRQRPSLYDEVDRGLARHRQHRSRKLINRICRSHTG